MPSWDLSDSVAHASLGTHNLSDAGTSDAQVKVWVHVEASPPQLHCSFAADLCCNFEMFIPVYLDHKHFSLLYCYNLVQDLPPLAWIIVMSPESPASTFSPTVPENVYFQHGSSIILLKVRTCHSFTQNLKATHFIWSKTIVHVNTSKLCKSCFVHPFPLLWPQPPLVHSTYSSHNDLLAFLPTHQNFIFPEYPMVYTFT